MIESRKSAFGRLVVTLKQKCVREKKAGKRKKKKKNQVTKTLIELSDVWLDVGWWFVSFRY